MATYEEYAWGGPQQAQAGNLSDYSNLEKDTVTGLPIDPISGLPFLPESMGGVRGNYGGINGGYADRITASLKQLTDLGIDTRNIWETAMSEGAMSSLNWEDTGLGGQKMTPAEIAALPADEQLSMMNSLVTTASKRGGALGGVIGPIEEALHSVTQAIGDNPWTIPLLGVGLGAAGIGSASGSAFGLGGGSTAATAATGGTTGTLTGGAAGLDVAAAGTGLGADVGAVGAALAPTPSFAVPAVAGGGAAATAAGVGGSGATTTAATTGAGGAVAGAVEDAAAGAVEDAVTPDASEDSGLLDGLRDILGLGSEDDINPILGTIGSLFGGWMQSNAADDAVDAQLQANRETIDFLKESRDMALAELEPYTEGSRQALAQMLRMQGIEPGPALLSALGDSDPGAFNFEADPGYQFRINEAQRMMENSAFARGGGMNGRVQEYMTDRISDYASNEWQNVFSRLGTTAGYGTPTQNASVIQGTAANVGNTMMDSGAARGSGYIAQGNAWANALNQIAGLDWQSVLNR